jgi:hypothetical protein
MSGGKRGFLDDQLSATHPDDVEIARLKGGLEDMKAIRLRKDLDTAHHNVLLVERDDEARCRFNGTHKTDAQLAAIRREEQIELFRMQRQDTEMEEDNFRALTFEEASLEFALLMHHDHLSLISMTVRNMDKNQQREQRNYDARAEARVNEEKMNAKTRKSLADEAVVSRHWVERDEQLGFKAVAKAYGDHRGECAARQRRREDGEAAAVVAAVEEAARAEQQGLDDELAAMEAAVEAKVRAISVKFADMQPVGGDAAAGAPSKVEAWRLRRVGTAETSRMAEAAQRDQDDMLVGDGGSDAERADSSACNGDADSVGSAASLPISLPTHGSFLITSLLPHALTPHAQFL